MELHQTTETRTRNKFGEFIFVADRQSKGCNSGLKRRRSHNSRSRHAREDIALFESKIGLSQHKA
jgi:hypothetical protein